MSLNQEVAPQFSFPQKPDTGYPLNIANAIVDWAKENLPFKICNNYRPERALEGKDVNCYGVSQGITLLANAWDLPAAVALDRAHAVPLVMIGTSVLAIEMTSQKPQVCNLRLAAGSVAIAGYKQLAALYEDHIPVNMERGQFCMYFTPAENEEDEGWEVRHTDTIHTGTDLTGIREAHIIVDAAQGADMLCAIGDLTRYRRKESYKYDEKFAELISFIPDFIDIKTFGENKEE